MGLQNQLSDVSSESPVVLVVLLLAQALNYLHSLLLAILHGLGVPSPSDHHAGVSGGGGNYVYDAVGSGLAGLIVLCDQLNLNKACSREVGGGANLDGDCVVCLSPMREGEQVRRLDCRHVFHKDCFDGWLDHLNFSCPICRAPLVASDESVGQLQTRVAEDLLAWFPFC